MARSLAEKEGSRAGHRNERSGGTIELYPDRSDRPIGSGPTETAAKAIERGQWGSRGQRYSQT